MLPPEEQPEALEAEAGAAPSADAPTPAETQPPAAAAEEPPPTVQWSAADGPPAEPSPAEGSAATATEAPAIPAGAPADPPTRVPPSEPAARTPRSAASTRSSATPAASDPDKLIRIGLISYASAATLALIYLFVTMSTADPHQLESLPDVPPLKEGETMSRVIPSADMPAGHTLSLGEAQRYGNIRVEPLRVTREPIEFAHFSGQAGAGKPATSPVLKLWVRFTNVSSDQTIAPLDAGLLYARTLRDSGRFQANQFVCRASEKTDDGEQVLVFDHPPTSEWDLVGQQLGTPLAPGESIEIFIPTEESGLDALSGELVWRMHFRKGYSPKGFGVTTVVEVVFDSSQIQAG